MNTVVNEMTSVLKCSAGACGFNTEGQCHAKGITIGDTVNPDCDTFLVSGYHSPHTQIVAGVGACKVSGCRFNLDFECTADTVSVGIVGDRVQCLSFERA